MPNLNFTVINHNARLGLELSIEEYCVADMIYHLSNNPQAEILGWCYASKEYFASNLGLGRATIFRAIKTLIEKGLVEKNLEVLGLVRATSGWYSQVVIKKDIPSQNDTVGINVGSVPSQNDTPDRLKMRRYNNIDNNTNKDNDIDSAVALRPKKENPYKLITDIGEKDFDEISEHYKVPVGFVKSKYEDMVLWAGERPNNPKLKGRNWRMTLMNWVKRDAIKVIDRAKGDPNRRTIDARNI